MQIESETFYVIVELRSLCYICNDYSGLDYSPLTCDRWDDKEAAMSRCRDGHEVRKISLSYFEEEV